MIEYTEMQNTSEMLLKIRQRSNVLCYFANSVFWIHTFLWKSV